MLCYFQVDTCSKELGDLSTEFSVHFNSYIPKEKQIKSDKEIEDGPVVERNCQKCGHDKLLYATVQLISADERQTVFFTCIKCKYKESENS